MEPAAGGPSPLQTSLSARSRTSHMPKSRLRLPFQFEHNASPYLRVSEMHMPLASRLLQLPKRELPPSQKMMHQLVLAWGSYWANTVGFDSSFLISVTAWFWLGPKVYDCFVLNSSFNGWRTSAIFGKKTFPFGLPSYKSANVRHTVRGWHGLDG